MSTTPAVPADSTDRDEPPTAPVTLRPLGSTAAAWSNAVGQLVYLALAWVSFPNRYKPSMVALGTVFVAGHAWRLVSRPDRTRLGPDGITIGRRRRLAWSQVQGVDVSDGVAGRYVRVRVAGRTRPIVLPAPMVGRGLRKRPPGTDRFERGLAELRRWTTTYAPDAVITVQPSAGPTAWPLTLVLLGTLLLVVITAVAVFGVG